MKLFVRSHCRLVALAFLTAGTIAACSGSTPDAPGTEEEDDLGDGGGDGAGEGEDNGDGDGDIVVGTEPIPCASDRDCKQALLLCDKSANVCVECTVDEDCGAESECFTGECEVIETCRTSLDCSGQKVCARELGRCFACTADEDCQGGDTCIEHECKNPCDDDADCADGVCDLSTGSCEDCATHDDCADSEYCNQGDCLVDICVPHSTQCVESSVGTCREAGEGWELEACIESCDVIDGAPICQGGEVDPCDDVIDDFEDGDGRICEGEGRIGPWFSWEHEDPLVPVAEGYMNTSALEVTFAVSAGVGLKLNAPDEVSLAYDASNYSGIRFFHQESAGVWSEMTHYIYVKTTSGTYVKDFPNSTAWTQVTLSWADLGVPEGEEAALTEVQWSFAKGNGSDPNQPQESAWLDNIEFY